tara:strand:+ start:149 stop:1033 length:885 start_codon:yes stop_codon:yes gene_type:complete
MCIQFRIFISTLALLTLSLISCESELNAEIPSFLEIESFDYRGNLSESIPYSNQYKSINISDAWVSMNGQFIGCFEIPCKIPILNEGTNTFLISPGIKSSGQSANRIIYPYYVKDTLEIDLQKDQSILIAPKTYYTNNLANPQFNSQGNFENSGGGTMFEIPETTNSNLNAVIQNEVVFQGQNSAAIFLDSIHNYFKIRNNTFLDLKPGTFLEIDFMSSVNFNVGLSILSSANGNTDSTTIQLYATDKWKKIYIDLSNEIALGNSFSKYKIFFSGSSNKHDTIYLDNLRLSYTL